MKKDMNIMKSEDKLSMIYLIGLFAVIIIGILVGGLVDIFDHANNQNQLPNTAPTASAS